MAVNQGQKFMVKYDFNLSKSEDSIFDIIFSLKEFSPCVCTKHDCDFCINNWNQIAHIYSALIAAFTLL